MLRHAALGDVTVAVRGSAVVRLERAAGVAPWLGEALAGVRVPLGAPWLLVQLDAGAVQTPQGPGARLRTQLTFDW